MSDNQASIALMVTCAMEQRGISVQPLADGAFAVGARGAMKVVDTAVELRALLERMGVRDLPPAGTWRDYEERKRAWKAAHLGASHDEYTQAMRRIASELGL